MRRSQRCAWFVWGGGALPAIPRLGLGIHDSLWRSLPRQRPDVRQTAWTTPLASILTIGSSPGGTLGMVVPHRSAFLRCLGSALRTRIHDRAEKRSAVRLSSRSVVPLNRRNHPQPHHRAIAR